MVFTIVHITLGNLHSPEVQLCWREYFWLTVFIIQYFKNVILLLPGLQFLLRNLMMAQWEFLCRVLFFLFVFLLPLKFFVIDF